MEVSVGKTLEERLAWVEHKARLQEGFAEVVDRDLSKLVDTTKSIQRTLEVHTKSLERHEQILESHSRTLNRVDQKVSGVDERVTVLDEKVTVLDEKVTVLDEKATVLDQKITAMDVKVDRRFVGLEGKMDVVLTLLTGRNQAAVPSARVASDGS
jgi:chromosome segregation ATPase